MDLTNKDDLTHEELVQMVNEWEARYYAFETLAASVLGDFILTKPDVNAYFAELGTRNKSISYSRDTPAARERRKQAEAMALITLKNAVYNRR